MHGVSPVPYWRRDAFGTVDEHEGQAGAGGEDRRGGRPDPPRPPRAGPPAPPQTGAGGGPAPPPRPAAETGSSPEELTAALDDYRARLEALRALIDEGLNSGEPVDGELVFAELLAELEGEAGARD